MTGGTQEARERLILALDFPSASACFGFLDRLNRGVPGERKLRWVKVGLELFLAEGAGFLGRLREDGYELFLDLKLHDIPNTVAGAVRSVLPLAPSLLTVHASGGPAMLAAAAEAAAGSPARLLAVTVLTSMDAEQLKATGVSGSPAEQVRRLALLAGETGIDGLVCSPREAGALRELLPDALLVTPGIRLPGAEAGDQRRTAGAAEALRAGASRLVVGRPITGARDPAEAYLAMLAEMASVL